MTITDNNQSWKYHENSPNAAQTQSQQTLLEKNGAGAGLLQTINLLNKQTDKQTKTPQYLQTKGPMPVYAAGAQGQTHRSPSAHTPPSTSESPPPTVTVPPHRDLSPRTHPVQKQTLMHRHPLPLTHQSKPALGAKP